MHSRRVVLCAFLCLSYLFLSTVKASFENSDSLPRLELNNLQYLGGFRLPAGTVNGDSYAGGGIAVAFNPAANSLFVSSYAGNVAEVSIPQPIISANPEALPFASFLQPFADPTEGHVNDATFGYGGGVSGLVVHNNRLYGTAQIYYDSMNEQRVSHYSRSLQLNQPSFSGWSQVWEPTKQGYVSGFLAAVPSEWQAQLGGAVLAGGCCIPIVSRTSFGPSAFAFNPMQIGTHAVAATPLLYYDKEHQTLGEWMNISAPNEVYNQSTEIHGMAVVAGTRTVLYIGRNGIGVPCYGNGTGNKSLVGSYGPDGALWCYDLDQSGKGVHAWPYRYQIWAYDLNDFAAVKAGAKQPWEVVPYGVWPLDLPTPGSEVRLGGASYDPATQTLYVAQRLADAGGLAYRPIMHVFHLDVAPPPAGDAVSTVDEVTLRSDKASPQTTGTPITFTAQPTGGVGPYQYRWMIWDGVTVTVAADWTAADRYTWTPSIANGDYRVGVWVRSAGNTTNAPEAQTAISFAIAPSTSAGRVSVSLVANRVAPQPPFTPITWTASAVGGVGPHQYKWLVANGSTTTTAVNWSPMNAFVWTPSTANANHRVTVWVRSAGSTADQPEAAAEKSFAITAPAPTVAPVSSVTLTSDKSSPQPPGTTVVFAAQAVSGVAPYQYQWWVFDGGQWTAASDWVTINTFSWMRHTPGSNYQVAVRTRSAGSTNQSGEATATVKFVLQ